MTRAAHVVTVVVLVGVGLAAASGVAHAQGPLGAGARARLSSDLKQRIENGDLRDERVIVTASAARIERLAARHGVRVKRWLTGGAVLEVPGHAVAALAGDPEVDHLATNQTLSAQDAVTNETIGADLVQAGAWTHEGGGEPYDGSGVGVALIDSGVALMPQLAGRVLARLDFTGAGSGLDAHGHGTHVAGTCPQ